MVKHEIEYPEAFYECPYCGCEASFRVPLEVVDTKRAVRSVMKAPGSGGLRVRVEMPRLEQADCTECARTFMVAIAVSVTARVRVFEVVELTAEDKLAKEELALRLEKAKVGLAVEKRPSLFAALNAARLAERLKAEFLQQPANAQLLLEAALQRASPSERAEIQGIFEDKRKGADLASGEGETP